MNETEVMIEVRELEKLFSLKGHERMFNNLFRSYGDKIVMLTAASRIKIWLEYVGYGGEYDAYKQQTELAKKYKLTEVYIYRIVKRMAEQERNRMQPSLFEV